VKTIGWLSQAANPIDLDDNDREAILERARGLKANWGVRFVLLFHSDDSPEPKWAYLYNRGLATDATPVITITRTTSDYTVIAWDFLQFLADGNFRECRANKLSDALDALEDIIDAVMAA
jgi:hypothetical protein